MNLEEFNALVGQYENYMYYTGLVISAIAIIWFYKFSSSFLTGSLKKNFYYIILGIVFNAIGLVALLQGSSKFFYEIHNVLMMIGLAFFIFAAKNLSSHLR